MRQEMMKPQNTGRLSACQITKFHFFLQIIIDEVLVLSDLVDLIPKYFIELENQNFRHKIQIQETMTTSD